MSNHKFPMIDEHSEPCSDILSSLGVSSPHSSVDDPNPQLYKNNMSGSNSEQDYIADEDKFFNSDRKQPTFGIQSEKPEHRLIVYLKAEGFSNREIARKLNYTDAWVSQITRQPWFQQRLIKELKDAGKDAVQSILEGEVANSILTAVNLRDDEKAPAAVRLNAAKSLWETVLGKPTQKTEVKDTTVPKTLEELNAELAALSEAEKAEGLIQGLN